MSNPTDERVAEYIARQDIWMLMQRYARGIDRWDADLVRSCYFDDAVDDHGDGYVGDVEGMIEFARETSRGFISAQHMICNHYCELDGDDAHAETYFMSLCNVPGGQSFVSAGRYLDHLQCRDGEWRIAERVVIMENMYDLPTSNVYPSVPAALATGDVHPWGRDRSDASYQRPAKPRAPREIWKSW